MSPQHNIFFSTELKALFETYKLQIQDKMLVDKMSVDKMPVKIAQRDNMLAGFGAGWTKYRSLKIFQISSIFKDTWA